MYFFNTLHLLQKDLKLEHGAELVSCPGRHLTDTALVRRTLLSEITDSCCRRPETRQSEWHALKIYTLY